MQKSSLLKIKILAFFSLTVFLSSCNNDSAIDLSQVDKTAKIIRFDSAFFNSPSQLSVNDIEQLSKEYPPFFSAGKSERFWNAQRNDELQKQLYSDIKSKLTDFKGLNENLNFSMKHVYYYFPNLQEVTFYGYVSNLDFDYPILYAPQASLCFVGLDMYLGPKQEYYQSQATYQTHFRQPAFLIRDCIDAVIEPYVIRNQESSKLIDDMIYYGKRLYILEKTLPQKNESIISQYSSEQLDFCHKNERTIWAYFIENKLLFDTSQDLKRRFIELAPFSKFRMKFDAETPGMIGRWVGWQIVKSYMEAYPETTLQELAQQTDSQKILKLSGYKP